MKRKVLGVFFLLASFAFTAQAQQKVQLTVKWNNAATKYEVYAKPNFTLSGFTWGPSQISVVTPNSVPNEALVITSVNAGVWGDNSRVYAPAAQSANDFHGAESSGSLVDFVSGQELLIFSFTLPGGLCTDGIRLFINGTDPNSSGAGMQGGDFRNTIDNGNVTDVYEMNYDNTGTLCNPCNVMAPELSIN